MLNYLYGLLLTDNAARLPQNVRGVGGADVRVIPCDGVAALVSTLDRLPERATLDDVRAHDGALQSVVNAGVTVAAARFRQAFDSDDETCRHVRDHGARVQRLLRDFDGCVEMRLLLRDTDALEASRGDDATATPAASYGGPGHEYLARLREQRDRVNALSLASALGPVVRLERVSLLPRDGGAVFAHLVSRGDVGEYRASVAAFPALHHAAVVGPLALYSFAEPSDE